MNTGELLRNSYAPEDSPGEEVDLLNVARRTVEIVAKRRARRSRISGTILIRGTEKNSWPQRD